jgi:hypothetical protein
MRDDWLRTRIDPYERADQRNTYYDWFIRADYAHVELKPHVPVDRATVPRITYPSQSFLVANSKADPSCSL